MKIERTMKRGVNAVKSTMNDFTISTLFSHFRHGDKQIKVNKEEVLLVSIESDATQIRISSRPLF